MQYKAASKQDALKQFLADSEEFYRTYYVARSVDGPILRVNGTLPIHVLSDASDFTFYIEVKPVRIEFETEVKDTGLGCYEISSAIVDLKPGTKVKVTIEEIV